MASNITVRNVTSRTFSIGSTPIPADGTPTVVDADNASVKSGLQTYAGRYVVLEDKDDTVAANAAITDVGAFTDPPSAAEMASLRTKVNSALQALRDHGIIAP